MGVYGRRYQRGLNRGNRAPAKIRIWRKHKPVWNGSDEGGGYPHPKRKKYQNFPACTDRNAGNTVCAYCGRRKKAAAGGKLWDDNVRGV